MAKVCIDMVTNLIGKWINVQNIGRVQVRGLVCSDIVDDTQKMMYLDGFNGEEMQEILSLPWFILVDEDFSGSEWGYAPYYVIEGQEIQD